MQYMRAGCTPIVGFAKTATTPPEEKIMETKVTIPALSQMKRAGQKSVGVVAWDYQIARIADRAGVDIVSVGDSVASIYGAFQSTRSHDGRDAVVCKAVRRAVTRALVSCDFPFGPLQEGTESAVRAAIRLVKEGGADLVSSMPRPSFPMRCAPSRARHSGVLRQFGLTPPDRLRYGVPYGAQASPGAQAPPQMTAKLVEEAKLLEAAGAALIDFTNSGPLAGSAVVPSQGPPPDLPARNGNARRRAACQWSRIGGNR